MRQVIPFTKNIEFKTMINEITNITLEHNLSLNNAHNINGDFFISGKYKINASSPNEETFSYKIPIDIDIDQSYKTDNIAIEIDDFKYSKNDSNKLRVDIDLSIDNLEKIEEKEREIESEMEELEIIDFDERKLLTDQEKKDIENLINVDNTIDLFKELPTEQELEIKEEKQNVPVTQLKPSMGSLFEAFKDTEETFSTYSVYIIRKGDNIEDIISKYKTTREQLEEYNDMSNIKIGTKLIIPNIKDEDNK